jgi:hypothetical protein
MNIRLFAALLCAATVQAGDAFRFVETNGTTLTLLEGQRPVFAYNHGVVPPPDGVPADRARSSYIHPLYGLDGETLTDDFPRDHFHHRGLFWAWPHVRIGDRHYDHWMLQGIAHRFVKWTAREADASGATLGLENGWFVGDTQVMREELRLRAWPATGDGRALDLEFTWTPLDQPVTLEGAEGKSYGGLTLRFAPRENTVITTPKGQGKDDLTVTRLPWADLSATFPGRDQPSGAAILVAPDHPDFPPEWLTRHYGVLCLGWPGVKPRTFPPDQPIRCRYRVWIHRGAPDQKRIQQEFEAFRKSPTTP